MASRSPLTPSDYYVAGLALLEEIGGAGVSAVSVCERLGVSRGSFYHHFSSFDDFVTRLLDEWDRSVSVRIEDLLDRTPSFAERSQILIDAAVNASFSRIDNALRAWAGVNALVKRRLAEIDSRRMAVLEKSMTLAGLEPGPARDFAHIAHATFVGLEVKGLLENTDLVRRLYRELQVAAMSRAASPSAEA